MALITSGCASFRACLSMRSSRRQSASSPPGRPSCRWPLWSTRSSTPQPRPSRFPTATASRSDRRKIILWHWCGCLCVHAVLHAPCRRAIAMKGCRPLKDDVTSSLPLPSPNPLLRAAAPGADTHVPRDRQQGCGRAGWGSDRSSWAGRRGGRHALLQQLRQPPPGRPGLPVQVRPPMRAVCG